MGKRVLFLVLVLSMLPSIAAGQPKQKEPTPTLDSVPGPTRALALKKSKHFYKLPDGSFLDTTNFDIWREVLARNLYVQERYADNIVGGPVDTTGRASWHEKVLIGRSLCTRDSDEAKAWSMQHRPVLAQRWAEREEVLRSADEHSTSTLLFGREESAQSGFYIVPNVFTKMAGHSVFTVETVSPEAVLLRVPASRFTEEGGGRWVEDATATTFVCEPNEKVFVHGKVKPIALFLFPLFEANDPKRPRIVTVNARREGLYRAVAADALRMTGEQVAKAAVAGELRLVDWTYKRTGDSFTWTGRVADVKSKQLASPATAPVSPNPTAPKQVDENP